MKKIKVIISKSSTDAVSDWDAHRWYQDTLASGNTACAATNVMFNELRVGVRVGEIEPFSFSYEGIEYNIGSTGQLTPEWPNGLWDHMLNQMDLLMRGGTREEAAARQFGK